MAEKNIVLCRFMNTNSLNALKAYAKVYVKVLVYLTVNFHHLFFPCKNVAWNEKEANSPHKLWHAGRKPFFLNLAHLEK